MLSPADRARPSRAPHCDIVKLAVAAFHMLRRAVVFADLGADYLDRIDKHRTAKRLVRRLGALGYDVMLQPKVAA